MSVLIADCESDGLLDSLTRVWTLQLGAADTDEVTVYADQPGYPPLSEAIARIIAADRVCFHNGFRFDFPVIERFWPGALAPEKIYDTLVAARLSDPNERINSLDAWGTRLGIPKGHYSGDFSTFSEDLVTYARQDIVVGRALYRHVNRIVGSWPCLDTEMRFAYLLGLQERNGFELDIPKARLLEADLRGELETLRSGLRDIFPPLWVPADKTPFTPKRDDQKKGYTAGASFTKVSLQVFNPGSRQQVASRLQRLGWKPQAFGKDGTPTVDDEVLERLPYPAARALVPFFATSKKLGQIADGKEAWFRHVKANGRCHGSVNTVGAASGRCSHAAPNMAQVNKKDLRMREVWKAREGWKLVGCDGSSIQARGLAHYLSRYDVGQAIQREAFGDKKLGTDTHSSNRDALAALGFCAAPEQDPSGAIKKQLRDGSKHCFYCVLFGGGDAKLGRTFKEECRTAGIKPPRQSDQELGKAARRALFRNITGFEELQAAIQASAKKRGYLLALDGFHIPVRSQHSALVFLLQGFEKSIMKRAKVLFHFEAATANGWEHGRDFGYCADVHDEVQIECRPDIAEQLGSTYAACIKQSGVLLGSRCPLEGEFSVGNNWKDTH